MSHIRLLFKADKFQWVFYSSCQLYGVNVDLQRKLMVRVGGECKPLDWLLFYQDLLCPAQLLIYADSL